MAGLRYPCPVAYGNNPPEKKTRPNIGRQSAALIACLLPWQVSILKMRYQSGEPLADLAAAYHIDPRALAVYAHAHGWKKHPRPARFSPPAT